MIETLKKELFKQFNPEEKKGIFLSGFSSAKELLVSEGVYSTDKPIRDVIEGVYAEHIDPILKDIQYIVMDVVVEVITLQDPNDIWEMDVKEYGVAVMDVEDDRTGVLLPNTSGVVDMKGALFAIKQKYGIHGQIDIAVFRTARTVIAK